MADGSIKNIEVIKGIPFCSNCEVEARRVADLMPKWKPGKQSGKPVNCYYMLPVKF